MLRVCQSHQSATNQAHLIPLPRHIHHSPIEQYSSRILLSSNPQNSTCPNRSCPLAITIQSLIHRSSLSHSTQLFLLDLPCTFYRSDLLFILSESTLPEQQRLHDNLSLIQPSAVCSFR